MHDFVNCKFVFLLFVVMLNVSRQSLAGDLGRLTNEQISAGFGQVQNPESTPVQKQNSLTDNPRWAPRKSNSSQTTCDDDFLQSTFGELIAGVVGATACGVYRLVDPPGESLWKELSISHELQLNTVWYFESRSSQRLLVGKPSADAARLDWSGTPGIQFRFATQPLLRLGTEFLFDYVQSDESLAFTHSTGFATNPTIAFADNTATTERSTSLTVGQFNFLVREEPFTFAFAGLRWWHDEDQLVMNVLPNGAQWKNRVVSDVPFLQLGGQYGAIGTRWMWTNRLGVGVGPSRNRSSTTVSHVVGTSIPLSVTETDFAALVDFKTEFAMAVTRQWSMRLGAQLIGISGRMRSAEQIDGTDLTNNTTNLNRDSVLLSGLFAGCSYQF